MFLYDYHLGRQRCYNNDCCCFDTSKRHFSSWFSQNFRSFPQITLKNALLNTFALQGNFQNTACNLIAVLIDDPLQQTVWKIFLKSWIWIFSRLCLWIVITQCSNSDSMWICVQKMDNFSQSWLELWRWTSTSRKWNDCPMLPKDTNEETLQRAGTFNWKKVKHSKNKAGRIGVTHSNHC